MRALLVGSELEENLAIRYLASALEAAGHETELAAFSTPGDGGGVAETVERFQPDIVGLSMTFQRRGEEFGQLATDLRTAGYKGHITAGGHFPTFAYREVLERYPALDSVVRHEGEITLTELCTHLESGSALDDIAGLVHRRADGTLHVARSRPLMGDLDAVRFPKRVGEPQLHMGIPAAFLVGSRGCYGHCTFCCINAYIKDAGGERYRERSADNIADEIAELRRERGARMLVFHDDDFFTRDHARDLSRVTALRDALRERSIDDIALVLKARPDDLDDEVFRVLAEIGLLRVYIGIEAGSSQGLKTLGRGVDMGANQRALDFLRRRDIYACFNMLIFDPQSTVTSLRDSLAFLHANADVPMNFCRTEIYPGTPLHRKLAREGRLIGDVFGWDYEIADPAAERAFRIFAQAFLDRNFRCDGLMNSNLSLGYYLHLLKQFYPKALTSNLRRRALATIERVNRDSVLRMHDLLEFATSPRAEDPEALAEFAELTTEEVARANRTLEEEVAETSQAILAAARGVARPRPMMRWGAAAAAAIALSPIACKHPRPPPPPDPLPPPSLREGTGNGQTVPGGPHADDSGRYAQPPPHQSADAGPVLPPPDPPPPPVTHPKPHPRPIPPPPDPLPPPTMKK